MNLCGGAAIIPVRRVCDRHLPIFWRIFRGCRPMRCSHVRCRAASHSAASSLTSSCLGAVSCFSSNSFRNKILLSTPFCQGSRLYTGGHCKHRMNCWAMSSRMQQWTCASSHHARSARSETTREGQPHLTIHRWKPCRASCRFMHAMCALAKVRCASGPCKCTLLDGRLYQMSNACRHRSLYAGPT